MEQSYNKKLIFRKATEADIPNIVKMLADDELGSKEDYKVPLPKSYYDAFQNIFQDKNQELIIFENFDKETIGTINFVFTIFDIPRWFKSSNRSSKNSQEI